MVDLVSQFKNNNFIVENLPISVNKRIDSTKIGNDLFINLKILALLRYIVSN